MSFGKNGENKFLRIFLFMKSTSFTLIDLSNSLMPLYMSDWITNDIAILKLMSSALNVRMALLKYSMDSS